MDTLPILFIGFMSLLMLGMCANCISIGNLLHEARKNRVTIIGNAGSAFLAIVVGIFVIISFVEMRDLNTRIDTVYSVLELRVALNRVISRCGLSSQ